MSGPPPRPPPPISPARHTTPTQDSHNPPSRPKSGALSSATETDDSKKRERSHTYSGPQCSKKSPTPDTPTTPTHPTPPSRLSSSSSSPPPPPLLPTVTEGERTKGRGRGRSAGRSPPSRPPPPARTRSLPRGGHLRMWEQANEGISNPHSKSSDSVQGTSLLLQDRMKSPGQALSPDSVPNGIHNTVGQEETDTDDVVTNDSDVTTNIPQEPPNQMGMPLDNEKEMETTVPSSPTPETTPTPSQPVIPPRPYRPPQSFPPPPSAPSSSSSSHSPGSKRKNKTHHGDPRYKPQPPPSPPASDELSKSVEVPPTTDHNTSHDDDDDVTTQATPPAPTEEQPTTAEEDVLKEEEPSSQPPQQARTLYDAATSASSHHRPPMAKGHTRLFKSVRKGLSKIRHKGNPRGKSVMVLSSSSGPPSSRTGITRMATDSALLEAAEEEPSEQYPDPLPQGIVDPLVVLCVAYLNRDCVLREAGLFRIPGNVASVKKLRTDYIRGQPVNLMEVLDPHTVAGLLKYHFREWCVSIIPRGKPLEEVTAAVREKNEERVQSVLHCLSQDNLATLRMVTELLSKVVEYSEWNKMTSGTLATSCGPSFFPYLPPSPANCLLKFMIDHCSSLFPE